MGKTYGQFCGLARALDHIGDRWTLLVIRELMLGEASYGHLLAALDGVATNLLAERLRELEDDGLVAREPDPADKRRLTYRLTPLGAGLEPALLALIKWGAHWMVSGPGGDRFDPRWTLLALRALLGGRTSSRRGIVEITVGEESVALDARRGRIEVRRGSDLAAGATVTGPPDLLLGVAAGELRLTEALSRGLHVRGDQALARAVLQPPTPRSPSSPREHARRGRAPRVG